MTDDSPRTFDVADPDDPEEVPDVAPESEGLDEDEDEEVEDVDS